MADGDGNGGGDADSCPSAASSVPVLCASAFPVTASGETTWVSPVSSYSTVSVSYTHLTLPTNSRV